MKFIVLIYPDGVTAAFGEDEETYKNLVPQIKAANESFEPYDDDNLEWKGHLNGAWVDVLGENYRARMVAPK